MRYAVVIEKAETGYSAYVPDLPGCVSVGRTCEDMDRNIREAIELTWMNSASRALQFRFPLRTPSTSPSSTGGSATEGEL